MKTSIGTIVLSTLTLLWMVDITASAQVQWALDTVLSTGAYSSGIAITPDGSKLVVTNNTNPGAVKVISTSNYAVSNIDISSIENYPNGVTITPNGSTALVNTLHKTVFIDLSNNSIKGNFAAPCVGTTLYGIAVTPDGNNAIFPDLSSGCTQQGLRSIDATGQSSGSSFILDNNGGQLFGIAITPDGTYAIVTGFTHAPTKVNLLTSVVQNITGMTGSYAVAILHNGNEALIFDGDSLYRASLNSNSVTKTISYLSYNTSFQNIAITADDTYAFVIGAFEKLIVSLANNSVIQTFSAGGTNVATTSDGSRFFVTDSYNGTVRVYKKVSSTGIGDFNVDSEIPAAFTFLQNYPNPFNPSTTIRYGLPDRSAVRIVITNTLGQEVAVLENEEQEVGYHEVEWHANAASGIYFYRIDAVSTANPDNRFVQVKKMLLLK